VTIQSLLLSPHPTRIKRIPISNGNLLRTSAVLNLFHNTTATLGVQTKTTKIDPFDVPDELTDSIWNTDFIEAKDDASYNPDDEDGVSKRQSSKRSKVQKMIDGMEPGEYEELVTEVEESVQAQTVPEDDDDTEAEAEEGEDEA
jgi:hypothetical protein